MWTRNVRDARVMYQLGFSERDKRTSGVKGRGACSGRRSRCLDKGVVSEVEASDVRMKDEGVSFLLVKHERRLVSMSSTSTITISNNRNSI